MKHQSFCVQCATLGPLGYMQAPGTIATLLSVPFVYYLRTSISDIGYVIFIIIFFIVSFFCIEQALLYFRDTHDPAEIVLDECLGCFITFYQVPMTISFLIVGFLLFRFFDIFKLFGIKKAEIFTGAWGVMLDDIMAALLSNVVLQVLNMYVMHS